MAGRKSIGLAVATSAWLLLANTSALGWGSTGHMITAQIAEDRLEPVIAGEVKRLIGVLADFDPKFADMVPAATWMDEIKGFDRGLLAFNNWHFYDQPYNPMGLPGASASSEENVVWAIGQAAATVGSPTATDFEKALMLRMLIHFVGDLHQPLHVTDGYSVEHPQGDFGGNLFRLSGDEADELHAFWDNTAGLFPRVKSSGDWSAISGYARTIEDQVPESELPKIPARGAARVGDWAREQALDWANESYGYGVSAAYAGIEEDTEPSPEYTARAQDVIKHRLAYGGYRLAVILNEVVTSGMQRDSNNDR